MPQTDVLIIGSGIAGLSVAIKVAQRFPKRRVVLITKQESAESNTRYAQGGIAVVSDFVNDSFENHVQDTLDAGDGLCDRQVVEYVVQQAPERLRELIELGAEFDRDGSGELILGREGGHRANRIIHFKDITGLNISTALLKKAATLPNVEILSHHLAIDLITQKDSSGSTRCLGVTVLSLNSHQLEAYSARVTVLATGGIGQLYQTTTNPVIATGDGIAMVSRAGGSVSNMEFIQFHPTAFYDTSTSPAFLISEAVRGQGAYLRNAAGERFMFRYHIDGELACRDVVSRAIATEIESSKDNFVYLDCTHIEPHIISNHFPNIYQTCLSRGIDMTKQYIPVAPAAHYLCGGIDVDLMARTTIANLYACGECSNTGLHGANRLASNSLLEATVYAHNCFEDIQREFENPNPSSAPVPNPRPSWFVEDKPEMVKARTDLQALMSRYVGIVRSDEGLEYAYHRILEMQSQFTEDEDAIHTPAWYEFRNMITCSLLIVRQSMSRKENRGGFYNKSLESNEVFG